MPDLFSIDESGDIIYEEESSNAENDASNFLQGDSVSDTVETSPSENESVVDSPYTSLLGVDDVSPVAVYTVDSAVAGTLSSTTLDYFDRVVDGLPSDYGYVAYKTSNDDSYAGSLIYGRDYDVNGNNIVFGKGATELVLSRLSNGNYNYYLQYDSRSADNTTLSLPSSGTLLYYTNLVDGRPILGKGNRPFEIAPYITVALLAVMASLVITRIVKGR